MEKSQLSQLKLKTHHSVSTLFQRVCSEANLLPEQLQVLAKYTSPDCPLSSIFPHVDALLSQPGLPVQLQASFSARSVGLDEYKAPEEASSSSSRDTVTGDGQHSLQIHIQHTYCSLEQTHRIVEPEVMMSNWLLNQRFPFCIIHYLIATDGGLSTGTIWQYINNEKAVISTGIQNAGVQNHSFYFSTNYKSLMTFCCECIQLCKQHITVCFLVNGGR